LTIRDAEALEVEADLAAAERAGLRLALIGRTLALLPIAGWYAWFGVPVGNYAGLAAVSAFMLLGFVHFFLLVSGRERAWHRYAFLALDAFALGVLVIVTPLSQGADDIPKILVFRAYGVYYLFLMLAVAALSLSPRLVMFAGATVVAMLWAVFGWIVSGMARTVTWGDLPPGADRDTFVRTLLDPDFIGLGNRVEESAVILATAALLAVAVHRARNVVRARARAERQRRRIQDVFGQYVPTEVAATILANQAALTPQTRVASILFSDIEGFTRLSERRPPAEMIQLLNEFFDAATEVIGSHRGVVVSFVGDAVVAAFNAPLDLSDHAAEATRAGQSLLALVAHRNFGGEALQIRVGIATGPVASGSVGGTRRQTWTVYGDTVNLAQRLEALNKELDTRLLVSEETARQAKGIAFREVGTTAVRGRDQPERVFTIEP
jgi:adenylate cyclase